MKVQLTRTKTNETFYIAKTYRDRKTGRSTSKIVRRLGTRSEIEGMLPPGTDVMGWAREEARRITEQERGLTRKVTVSYDPARQIAPGEGRASNVGYLFLQDIYFALGWTGSVGTSPPGARRDTTWTRYSPGSCMDGSLSPHPKGPPPNSPGSSSSSLPSMPIRSSGLSRVLQSIPGRSKGGSSRTAGRCSAAA